MSYHISKPVSTKTLPPAGTHIARVFSIIHIGTHEKEGKDGKPWEVGQMRISFELPHEMKVFKEGDPAKPVVITKKYTESLGEKANLRKLIEAVIGTTLLDEEAYAFDVHEVMGRSCLITIKHKISPANKEEYAYVESVNALMKGQVCPPPINSPYIFTVSPFDEEKFASLPDFIQKEIMESPEYVNRLNTEDKSTIKELRDNENKTESGTAKSAGDELNPLDIPF